MTGGSKTVLAYMRPCMYAKSYLLHKELPLFMSNGDHLCSKRMLPQLQSFCYTEDGEYHGLIFLEI